MSDKINIEQLLTGLGSLYKQLLPDQWFGSTKFSVVDWGRLINWCHNIYLLSDTVWSAVNTLAQYPITKIKVLVNKEYWAQSMISKELTPEIIEQYFKHIIDQTNLRQFMIDMAKQYFIFGNVVVYLSKPFIRRVQCPKCRYYNEIAPTSYITKENNVAYRVLPDGQKVPAITYTFVAGNNDTIVEGSCFNCKYYGRDFICEDLSSYDISFINLVILPLERVEVLKNEITGWQMISYTPKPIVCDVKNIGNLKQQALIDTTPISFLKAGILGKAIELPDAFFMRNNVYQPLKEGLKDGFGVPPLLPILRLAYQQILVRALSTLMLTSYARNIRLLVPRTSGYEPRMSGGEIDASTLSAIAEEIRKVIQNPDYIPIFPIPVDLLNLDSGGIQYLAPLLQESRELSAQIAGALGIPYEMLLGRTTWSGGAISMRFVENMFMRLREQLEDFLKWFKRQVSLFIKMERTRNGYLAPNMLVASEIDKIVELKFADLKTVDDPQRRGILLGLLDRGVLDSKAVLKELDLDKYEPQAGELPTAMTIIEQWLDQLNKLPPMERDAALRQLNQLAPNLAKLIRRKRARVRQSNEEKKVIEAAENPEPLPEQKPPRRQTGGV